MLKPGSLVYVASPYSHPEAAVRQQRYEDVRKCTLDIMHRGAHAFSPILYGHNCLPELNHWKNDEWLAFDFALLGRCDMLVVLMLPGWDTSHGVQAEMAFAKEKGIETLLIEPAALPDKPGGEVPVQPLAKGI